VEIKNALTGLAKASAFFQQAGLLLTGLFDLILACQVLFRMLNRYGATESYIAAGGGGDYGGRNWFVIGPVLMNKIQVQCEEKQVKSEEVYDLTDTSFHKIWIGVLISFGFRF
jgi:hypothetical protein